MYNPTLAESNLLPDKVYVEFNMLSSSMMSRMAAYVARRHIVAENNSGLLWSTTQFIEQLTEPCALGNRIGNPSVLSLCT